MTFKGSRTARIAFWAAVLIGFFMAVTPHPPHLPTDNFGDKFHHIMAFAVMTLLAAVAYPQAPLLRIAERLCFFGAVIEVVQSIPALHRDCDIMDWIADSISIAVVLTLLSAIRRRSS